ncbi:lactadherin-like [Ylistrum balloti]|uniref:lactadherin-like n=1 Tax=Ylistrum balloti TaxID=509963 RepID=UPI002905BF4B|nr:lactadherin-like [Ylistrum balloti]
MKKSVQHFGLLYMMIQHVICDEGILDLVTGENGISDNALTASSYLQCCPAQMARFNSSRAWCAGNVHIGGEYIQVEFKTVSTLKAIETLGRADSNQWVSSYNVNISLDGITWNYIMNSTTGEVKRFPGNFDRLTIVTNELDGNVISKYIRIIPITFQGYLSMRLEVQGCPAADLCSEFSF